LRDGISSLALRAAAVGRAGGMVMTGLADEMQSALLHMLFGQLHRHLPLWHIAKYVIIIYGSDCKINQLNYVIFIEYCHWSPNSRTNWIEVSWGVWTYRENTEHEY
jgi:hypothetical protein